MSKQNVIGFYDLENENAYLCNWYASPFELDGIRFCCMEQYMMYRKAVMFHDEEAMATILASEDPDLWRGKNLLGYALMEVLEQVR